MFNFCYWHESKSQLLSLFNNSHKGFCLVGCLVGWLVGLVAWGFFSNYIYMFETLLNFHPFLFYLTKKRVNAHRNTYQNLKFEVQQVERGKKKCTYIWYFTSHSKRLGANVVRRAAFLTSKIWCVPSLVCVWFKTEFISLPWFHFLLN